MKAVLVGFFILCGASADETLKLSNRKTIADKAETVFSSPDAGTKAKEKCREYANYIKVERKYILLPNSRPISSYECPLVAETLIVGGSEAKLNEFPHMALIGINKNERIEWFCGGSLISPMFIVSAAHCNISKKIGKVVARLGDLNTKNDTDKAKPINVEIVQVYDHPKYDYSNAYHDISLLKMKRNIHRDMGPNIRPLCLHTERTINHKHAIASGWGRTSSGGITSDHLQKVNLTLNENKMCRNAYRFESTLLPEKFINDIMLCAGERNKDTCQGDSGGPLQIQLKDPHCMYSLIGITSFGIKCGTSNPGGYTRVSHYVPWIESIVWP